MPRLADLAILDYTPEIARIPLRRDHVTLPLRAADEAFVTFHYSAVVYADRSRAAELGHILDEARYQVNHDYSSNGSGAYPDGYLYDFSVLSDGLIVRTRKDRRQLWHAGNIEAAKKSWSVHVLLGSGQNLTGPQRASLFALFDALRAETNIPRQNVVAHCEWPRTRGLPIRSDHYRLLPRQSACPGPTLFPHVVAYRNLADAPRFRYRVTVDTANIRQGPGTTFLVAGQLHRGDTLIADKVLAGQLVGGDTRWAHIGPDDPVRANLGFVHLSLLEAL